MSPSSPVTNDDIGFDFENHSHSHSTSLSPKNGIPLPAYHIRRTESEVQLHEDMAVAEYRDRCMFNRLVTGIRRRQQKHYESQYHQCFHNQQSHHSTHPTMKRSRQTHKDLRHSLHATPNLPETIHGIDQESQSSLFALCAPSTVFPKQSQEQTQATASSMITPIASDGEETNAHRRKRTSDDWAIEGFDEEPNSPACPRHVNVIPSGWFHNDQSHSFSHDHSASFDHNEQFFDMDLWHVVMSTLVSWMSRFPVTTCFLLCMLHCPLWHGTGGTPILLHPAHKQPNI